MREQHKAPARPLGTARRHGPEEVTLVSTDHSKVRRSYGTGSLYVRTDTAGREAWYGHWRTDGRQLKRRIGDKRTTGGRDGLTKVQAQKRLRELIAETVPTAAVKGDALTIEELGRRYVLDLERRKRKGSTVIAVESVLNVHLIPYFGDKAITKIKREDVADLVTKMEGDGLAAKSVRNYIGTLSALFNYARGANRRWAAENPCDDAELQGREESEEIRYLELTEIDALVDAACEGDYQRIDRALYLTAAQTGMRQGELIALRWKDVGWKIGKIRVRRTYSNKRSKNGEIVGFTLPKTKKSSRSVPMSDEVAGELDRLFKVSEWQDDGDLVFADPRTGGPLQCAAILRRYRRALKAAKLDEGHVFHDLRHSYGTAMAGAGVPMRALQEWMGHCDMSTTEIYAAYSPNPHEAQLVATAFARDRPEVATEVAT